MFIARLSIQSISLRRSNVSEIDHAGHAYSSVDRITIIYIPLEGHQRECLIVCVVAIETSSCLVLVLFH